MMDCASWDIFHEHMPWLMEKDEIYIAAAQCVRCQMTKVENFSACNQESLPPYHGKLQ